MPYKDLEVRKQYMKEWLIKDQLKNPDKYKEKAAKDNSSPQHKISSRAWRENNPEHQAEYYLSNSEKIKIISRKNNLKKIGWTPEMYTTVLLEQSGVCAICGNVCPSGRNLAADHEHVDPPKPRGLLCVVCNLMIGYARDNQSILIRAANYLKKYKDSETTQGEQK